MTINPSEEILYRQNIMDHYRHPRNKESMQFSDKRIRQVNPTCGDELEIFIKLEDGKVEKISFQGEGCALSQATMSILSEELIGMNVKEISLLKKEDVFDILGINIIENRENCALLSLRGLQEVIKNG